MESQETVQQNVEESLVILGNGFDIQRKLKTSYSDFMKTQNPNKTDNLWIYILSEMFPENADVSVTNLKWYDIEGLIQKVVTEYHAEINQYIYYLHLVHLSQLGDMEDLLELDSDEANALLRRYQEHYRLARKYNPIQNAVKKIADFIVNKKELTVSTIQEQFIQKYHSKEIEEIHDDLIINGLNVFDALLLKELKDFEDIFSTYVSTQVESTKKGNDLNIELFKRIKESGDGLYKHFSILCFNYTNPIVGITPKTFETFNVNNVHGTLDEQNIIFGIDLTEEFKEEQVPSRLVPFTKTFRKMKISSPKGWKLPKEPDFIRCYGHSLSIADYSYFQSVFDYVNIYDSTAILEFCFSLYGDDPNREENLQNEQAKNVYELINTYGATLTNKDQGKNLLHKLLVENRLKIRQLPEIL